MYIQLYVHSLPTVVSVQMIAKRNQEKLLIAQDDGGLIFCLLGKNGRVGVEVEGIISRSRGRKLWRPTDKASVNQRGRFTDMRNCLNAR